MLQGRRWRRRWTTIDYFLLSIFYFLACRPETRSPIIRITASGHSDKGLLRSENQDHFLIADLGRAPESGRTLLRRDDAAGRPRQIHFTLTPHGALALVADGMGGAAAGEIASRTATAAIYDAIANPPPGSHTDTGRDFAHLLRRAVEIANTHLHQLAEEDPDLAGMGTTATVAGILGATLYVAQIGDSRAYLVRHGTARQLTRDQSRVQALVDAGLLTPAEARQSPQRHIILQALGPDPEVEVGLTSEKLHPGDIVVLTTDGLHDLVEPAELAAIAAPHQSDVDPERAAGRPAGNASNPQTPDPAAACQALVELGNERGGPDNITVVIMHLDGPDLADPRPDDSAGRQRLPYSCT